MTTPPFISVGPCLSSLAHRVTVFHYVIIQWNRLRRGEPGNIMKGTLGMKRVIMKYWRVKSKSPICFHFLFLCACAKGPILCLGSIRSCSPNWWQVCQSTRSERYMWNNISPRGKVIRNLYYWLDLESSLTYKVQILCGVTFFCFAGHAFYLWRNHPWCDHQPPRYP